MSGGSIVHIETENFKSYKGRQVIGPFHKFTCIIGPNGAGKSNLMDAISFVVGLRAAFLRSTNLKQLIYNADGLSESTRRTAFVELVFRTKENENIHFRRTINHDGTSQYFINDNSVQATKYDKKLSKYGILTKARNFLVFQGDVESIAAKSPMDLTKLFEQISGSDEYKAEYDSLKAEYEKVNNLVISNLQKKKFTSVEKSKIKAQKKEADKYDEKVIEHLELQKTYVLWKLYHIEVKINNAKKEKDDIDNRLITLQAELKATQDQLQKKRQEYARLRKENIALIRDVKSFQKQRSDKGVAREKIRVQISHCESEISKIEEQLERSRRERENNQTEIANLERELSDVEAQEKSLEERMTAQRSRFGELTLTRDQEAEYLRLKTQAGIETVTLNQRLAALKSERASLEEQLKSLQQKNEELTASRNRSSETLDRTLRRRLANLREAAAAIERILNEKEVQRDNERRAQEQRKKERDENQKNLEEVSEKLRDARVDKKASQREERFKEALESMKLLFKGVHGKLIDLCRISRERYQTAVHVAIGTRNSNAIVVDTEKVALDCIEYLREQRVSVATFIPLDTIKAKMISDRLRSQLENDQKLVLDVLAFDKQFEKAFRYALGNTVVCNTLDDARVLCFERNLGERIKAVTLDGTVISKSGMITGGQVDAVAQATRPLITERDIEDLKVSRDNIIVKLQELTRDEAASAQNVARLETDIATLQSRLRYTNLDIESTTKRIEAEELKIRQINEQLDADRPQMDALNNSINVLNRQIADIEREIKEIEDRIFGPFSQRLGITNIREYENERLRIEKEGMDEKARLQVLKDRIAQRLEYLRTRVTPGNGTALQQQLDEQRRRLNDLRSKLQNIEAEISNLDTQERELANRQNDMKRRLSEKDTELSELQIVEQTQFAELQRLEKVKTERENFIERLRNERKELFLKCRMEDIDLPVIEEEEQPSRKRQRTTATTSRQTATRPRRTTRTRSSQQAEEESEEGEPSLTQSERFNVSQVEEQGVVGSIRGREEYVTLDFSELDPRILDVEDEEYQKIDEEFRDDLQALEMEINALAPLAATVGRIDVANKKYEETIAQYRQAKEQQRDVQRRFKEIQQKRYNAFIKAFDPISQSIDKIYKDLTRSEKFPLGGTAYLGMMDPDEPYLAGVKFNAMPPMKRYRDMDQLSGGEKTVAALALLFAIHSFRPSPFFILDEVDAALDNVNVLKVANYLLNKKDECQFIVISLKENLFSLSDALCGVYRDQATKSSGILTLNLSAYGNIDTTPTSVSKALATPATERRAAHEESFAEPAEEAPGEEEEDDVAD
jgi:structural maintenance of chromosome 1